MLLGSPGSCEVAGMCNTEPPSGDVGVGGTGSASRGLEFTMGHSTAQGKEHTSTQAVPPCS